MRSKAGGKVWQSSSSYCESILIEANSIDRFLMFNSINNLKNIES